MIRAFVVGLATLGLAGGCGRYFAGPIRPVSEAGQQGMEVRDDGSVVYVKERLEIGVRPMTDAELNRQFAAQSSKGLESTNPYTYANSVPMGEDHTPQRFTVFELRAKNYSFPKVMVDVQEARISTANGRRYDALGLATLDVYYRAPAVAYSGNTYHRYRERSDLLRRTMWANEFLFSGQERVGYLVFPVLADDVTAFAVQVPRVGLRFDYRDVPVEEVDLGFSFERQVYKGYHPPATLADTE
ncbi:MAG: hypothetical protein AB1505_29695 [Candidatus Latescibacterota bacterium]